MSIENIKAKIERFGNRSMMFTRTEVTKLLEAFESQKTIAELAIKGLIEIESLELNLSHATHEQEIAIRTLSEIERLQNATS